LRIFIALLFSEKNKKKIYEYQKNVEQISKKGNFTSFNNLHLTMLYIGETELSIIEDIYEKLSEIVANSFSYKTKNIKYFQKSGNRKILYLSLKETYKLQELYVKVVAKIKEVGLNFSNNKFTPHITLARQVLLDEPYDELVFNVPELDLDATKLSVMESTRINGKLIYRELYSIKLN
jgi:RNA 2',3'-cyclic 3'-phosphodiesterase